MKGEIIFFIIACFFLSIATGFYEYYNQLKIRQKNRALKLTLQDNECWWSLDKQHDNSFVTQISLKINVLNLTNRPIGLIKARLIFPKAQNKTLIMLSNANNVYDRNHKAPPYDSAKAQLNIQVCGTLAPKGQTLSVTVGITDEFCEEYQLEGIIMPAPGS